MLQARMAEVAVRDHGIGLPADTHARIFDRTHRAPNATGAARGLGLGLSISAEIIKRHRGSVEARTAESMGSVFIVRLTLSTLTMPHVNVRGQNPSAAERVR
jgi:K+-sensing histidine kinase KdpD